MTEFDKILEPLGQYRGLESWVCEDHFVKEAFRFQDFARDIVEGQTLHESPH